MIGLCAEFCSRDSDCPNNQKCCSNGCGHQCMPPYRGIYMMLMCGSIFSSEGFSDEVSVTCVYSRKARSMSKKKTWIWSVC